MRHEREQRRAISSGVVSRDPQTPERLRDTLPIHHPPPLLSNFARLHTPQRAPRRAHLEGQTPLLPNDTARPAMIDDAQKVPRPEGAIGNPEVTRLHRLEDATEP